MSERPRFTIQISIKDNYGFDNYHMATGCDEAMRISERAVDELKAGLMGSMSDTAQVMRTREMRRDLLVRIASQLANQMADRLEDAEGWHDPSRVEPAQKALGGRWSK